MVESGHGGALNSSVLVLNRMYIAVHVIHVRRAICLLCRNLAEVIHIDAGHYTNHDFESWLAVSELNARARAANFSLDDLDELLPFLHRRHVKGYVTLNTLVFPSELPGVEAIVRRVESADREWCEVIIVGHGRTIRARAAAPVPLASVDLVVEKLEHQLEKTKGRLVARTHPRRRPANSVFVLRERVRTA